MRHLVTALESALSQRNYYAALALALTLPDIVGWVRNPKSTSRQRCVEWFDLYIKQRYFRTAMHSVPAHQFLTGNDFYALRCSYLHEGRDEILSQRARNVLDDFEFVVCNDGMRVHCNQRNSTLQLQVDVFCRDIADGIESCLADLEGDPAAQQRLATLLTMRDLSGKVLI